MTKQMVIDLIGIISKSNDKNVIYKALVKIRAEFVKDASGIELFLESGGIPPLCRLISKPYEKIIEMSLSILANCCTMKESCKQAISHGVVPPILTILKNIPNSSVQCRACRLIGNLARESNEKICNLAKGIGITMASVLNDHDDVYTLNMAIRAARLLWNEMPFHDEFVRHGGVKKIIEILVRHTKSNKDEDKSPEETMSIVEKCPVERERVQFMEDHIRFLESINSRAFDREIIKKSKPADDNFTVKARKDLHDFLYEILRGLQAFTNGNSLRVIFDFYENEQGCSCIVFLAKHDSLFRPQALKILSNLSKSQSSNEFLSRADAVTTACHLMTMDDIDPPLSEAEERHCISVICFLAGDACNRAKIRISGVFTKIIEIAKCTKCDTILTMILILFQSFKYDSISIDLLIKMGLVNVLVERLGMNTRDLTETHTKKINKTENVRNGNDDMAQNEINPKRLKIDFYNNLSPASPSFPNSPCSSTSVSPQRNNDLCDDMDSEYSPVCSDIEDDENPTLADRGVNDAPTDDKENMCVMKLLEECNRVENDIDDPEVQSDEDEAEVDKDEAKDAENIANKKKTVHLILEILASVSYRMKHASNLCTPTVMNTLIKTCRVAFSSDKKKSRWDEQAAPSVLSHILTESTNFVPIIKQDFIFKFYEMTQVAEDHEECLHCCEVRSVGVGLLNLMKEMGESGYGRGALEHLLCKGDPKMKKQIAVIILYIICNPKTLNMLLVSYGALYTAMDIILTKGDELSSEATLGFTSLCKVLDICAQKYEATKIDKKVKFDSTKSYTDEADSIVTFIAGPEDQVTAETCVEFKEELLINFSDVFNSMLRSDFKESKDRKIHLKNQTIMGVKYFLDSIQQQAQQQTLCIPDAAYIGAVLETYDMCQIYMMPDLESDVFNMILYLLDERTVLKIFEFSISNHKEKLSDIAINYYLSANIPGEKKVKMYRDADDSEYFKEWNQMMLDTVVDTIHRLVV